jgi:hypothetical protein
MLGLVHEHQFYPAMNLFTRSPIFRMAQIRRKLLSGEKFNATTLAGELEVSAKTIHRDIDFLRDFLNYEINFNGSINSFEGRPGNITTL